MHVVDADHAVEGALAEHLASVEWADIPPAAIEQASRAVLWWIATALEGGTDPEQAALIRYVMAQESKEESTIIGTPHRSSCELAGLVNGRAGKAFEHEDKYWVDESIGFAVGCCVVPAAMAAAEAIGGVSGKRVLAAVALGIDLEARLIAPLGLGFIPGSSAANATFALGNYGAAAAASKLYGLGATGHLDALGLAHAQACGNFQGQVEGRSVAVQAGFAVRNGLAASRLASAGVTGVRGSVTGAAGLYAVHYPGSEVDPQRIVDGLGVDYLGCRLGFKAHPCGIVAHPALDAVKSLLSGLGNSEVARIDVTGPNSLQIMAEPIDDKRAPASAIEAMFSIPWAVACTVRDGGWSIDHYGAAALGDSELRSLAATVSVAMRSDVRGTSVRVTAGDGSILESPVVMVSKGHPDNPVPTAEMQELLIRAAKRVGVRPSAADQVLTKLMGLEDQEDVGDIMRLLGDMA